jgi:hypothetical protein
MHYEAGTARLITSSLTVVAAVGGNQDELNNVRDVVSQVEEDVDRRVAGKFHLPLLLSPM